MSDIPFEYKPELDTRIARYEYVGLKDNTPRNPTDYHDIQSILRYRQALSVYDLFGNLRIVPSNNAEPLTFVGGKFQLNGVFYLDGYRINLNGVTTTTISVAETKDVYLFIKLGVITYSEDPTIALTAYKTKQSIETSYRYDFEYSLKAYTSGATPDSATYLGYAARYKIGTMTYSSVYTYSLNGADFVDVDKTYQDALEIINSSIHTLTASTAAHSDDIDKTVIENMSTAVRGLGNVSVKTNGVDNIKLVFEDAQQNLFAAFEAIKTNGTWNPIIWMQSSASEVPTMYMTPDSLHMFDNNNNVDITLNSLNIGSTANSMVYRDKLFNITQDGKNALDVSVNKSGKSTDTQTALTPDQGVLGVTFNDNAYSPYVGVDDSSNPLATATATIAHASLSNENNYNINHKIYTDSTVPVSILAVVKATDVVVNSLSFIGSKTYLLGGDLGSSVEDSITVNLTQNMIISGNAVNFQVEYTITNITDNTAVSAIIGFLKLPTMTQNITWNTYGIVESVVNVNVLKMNGWVLWIDDDGRLRRKQIPTGDDATAINAMKTNAAGDSVGGYLVGSSPAFTVEVDNTQTAPVFSSGEQILYYPMASIANVTAGLLSYDDYTYLMGAAGGATPNPYMYPVGGTNSIAKTVYVSQYWSVLSGKPSIYVDSVGAALNIINPVGGSSGVIVLYPGTYSGNYDLSTATRDISIIALDPKHTLLTGTFTSQTSQSAKLYIDCPMTPSAGEAVIGKGAEIHLGKNTFISSIQDASVIKMEAGSIVVDGYIEHIATINDLYPTIDFANTTYSVLITLNGDILSTLGDASCISHSESTTMPSTLIINHAHIRSGSNKCIEMNSSATGKNSLYIYSSTIGGGLGAGSYSISITSNASLSECLIYNTNFIGNLLDTSGVNATNSKFNFFNCTTNATTRTINNHQVALVNIQIYDSSSGTMDMNLKQRLV